MSPGRPAGPHGPVGSHTRGRTAGTSAPAPAGAADVGLFGPGSVTWRLHAEPLLGLAALRALLLQALEPHVAHAAGQRSSMGDDVWGRLQRTTEFLGVTTYGTSAQALSVGAHVRALHAAMAAVDPGTGDGVRIDDPVLLAWVHCTMVDSVLDVLRRSGMRLDDADADQYVREQVRAAMLVGLEPDEVPCDQAGLDAALRDARPRLRASAAARDQVGAVVAAPLALRLVPVPRPAWSAVAGLAFAALPPWARRMYAMAELPGAAGLHGAATTVALHTLRASLRGVHGVVPPLREGRHLRSARERLAAPPEASP